MTGPLRCPVCGQVLDLQPEFSEGFRVFQFGICDNPECAVSSVRFEWRRA